MFRGEEEDDRAADIKNEPGQFQKSRQGIGAENPGQSVKEHERHPVPQNVKSGFKRGKERVIFQGSEKDIGQIEEQEKLPESEIIIVNSDGKKTIGTT